MSTAFVLVLVASVKYAFCESDGMEGFIVGGETAFIKEHPHAAYIAVNCHTKSNEPPKSWLCGGSVVNQLIILTAAHCFHVCSQRSYILVRVGAEDKREVKQQSAAMQFVFHDGFNDRTVTHDIGLIILKKKLKLGPKVQRVALMKEPPVHQIAEIAGWGRVSEQNDKTNVLKAAKQRLLSIPKCEKLLHVVPPHTICAGDLRDENYVAKGDSGSALIVEGFIQIGIVSFRTPQLSKGIAVYTKVQDYIDWIHSHVKMLYCKFEDKVD